MYSVHQIQTQAPTSPPPRPPPLPSRSQNADTRISKLVLKMRSAPPGWAYQSPNPPRFIDYSEPRTGPYFFYGTLMDPKMLAEILQLNHEPILRPAQIVGYACKLWGQYPAIVDGEMDATIDGAAYDVESVEHARRLAAYETSNYQAKPCKIIHTDGKQPETQHGRVFMFAGNPSDLEAGEFDLSVWLKRVGR
ncbi:poly(A) polymerase pla1, putative [Cordyceps militaris CM01]|uniref:Putative gamma-glutamylcyclotransferase n=1 Tax=Cordyceps militaris (strain CM01) TaxID=983644 RepID=G3JSX4_CORMM|nr:poly(A) polymerase pla1, putative [Cordyceps militaris CM01]EGX88970.1 poly(A) polymerase pla1, putative [Cordyceps militaris CM01]